jgi:hypothetical protein
MVMKSLLLFVAWSWLVSAAAPIAHPSTGPSTVPNHAPTTDSNEQTPRDGLDFVYRNRRSSHSRNQDPPPPPVPRHQPIESDAGREVYLRGSAKHVSGPLEVINNRRGPHGQFIQTGTDNLIGPHPLREFVLVEPRRDPTPPRIHTGAASQTNFISLRNDPLRSTSELTQEAVDRPENGAPEPEPVVYVLTQLSSSELTQVAVDHPALESEPEVNVITQHPQEVALDQQPNEESDEAEFDFSADDLIASAERIAKRDGISNALAADEVDMEDNSTYQLLRPRITTSNDGYGIFESVVNNEFTPSTAQEVQEEAIPRSDSANYNDSVDSSNERRRQEPDDRKFEDITLQEQLQLPYIPSRLYDFGGDGDCGPASIAGALNYLGIGIPSANNDGVTFLRGGHMEVRQLLVDRVRRDHDYMAGLHDFVEGIEVRGGGNLEIMNDVDRLLTLIVQPGYHWDEPVFRMAADVFRIRIQIHRVSAFFIYNDYYLIL